MPGQVDFQNIPAQRAKVPPASLTPTGRKGEKQGSKVLFDGSKMESATLTNARSDLNKITLIIPPNSKVTMTLTMADNSQKKMVFDNIGAAESLKARVYFDIASQTFGVAESDVRSAKPAESGPASQPFQTNRLVTRIKKEEDEVLFSGDAENGVKKMSPKPAPAPAPAQPNNIPAGEREEALPED